MPNVERLQAVLDAIETNPDHHAQDFWSRIPVPDWTGGIGAMHEQQYGLELDQPVPLTIDCGTKSCAAGIATEQAGYRFVYTGDARLSLVQPLDPDRGGFMPNSEPRYARDVAMELLELTEVQAQALFDAENTRRDLWATAFAITDGTLQLTGETTMVDVIGTLTDWELNCPLEVAGDQPLPTAYDLEEFGMAAYRYLVAADYRRGLKDKADAIVEARRG